MKLTIVVIAALLTGCSVSDVRELDGGYYTVSARNLIGLQSRDRIVGKATDEATDFCAERHQVPKVDNSAAGGLFLLTPTDGTIVFRCVPAEEAGK